MRPAEAAALPSVPTLLGISTRLAANLVPLVLAFATAFVPGSTAGATDTATSAGTKGATQPEASRLPGFEGRTLDGRSISTSSFSGKRLILLCFNPDIEQAKAYAQAIASVEDEQRRYNFAVAGVALGVDSADARAFAARLELDVPILDDSDGRIGVKLGLQSPLTLVGSDADGRVGLTMVGFEHDPEIPAAAIEARIREYLRLPPAGAGSRGKLDASPKAPAFEAERIGGGDRFRLSELSGRPVVLTFFLSTCPHCIEALRFFKDELARMPAKIRPAFVGVAIDPSSHAVATTLEEKKVDFFPVLADADREVSTAYGSFGAVPDILLIDADGRIVDREKGWYEQYSPNVMRMRLARLAGIEVPMLVERDGFSGNDACAVCHPMEAATWRFTAHAAAFDSLVLRGADRDPKCVGCHVVGFGERGGYSEAGREKHLEDVGCETCHGRGGEHLGGEPAGASATATGDYRTVCERCHDAKHSLGFDYGTFHPRISHVAILALEDAEREKLAAGHEQPRELLPTAARFVGSAACQRCHEQEYAIWSRSAHARSAESLRKKAKDDDEACVRCHVTGYGRPGGFPDGERAGSDADLSRVGCESCHGPGGEHVEGDGKRLGGIVKLGDKCDTCVILKICGTCHDDANDPEFRFSVVRKIDAQRHGAGREARGASARNEQDAESRHFLE